MVDKDGKIEYSRIVSVQLKRSVTFSLSPNPARYTLSIKTNYLQQNVQVQIIDAAGNRIYNVPRTVYSRISHEMMKNFWTDGRKMFCFWLHFSYCVTLVGWAE